jgi:hypothetical protein
LSSSPSSKVSGLNSVNTALLNTTSLDSAQTTITNLVTELTNLKATIDTANTNAANGDISTTGCSGSTGLDLYKAELTTISTSLAAMITLLNGNIATTRTSLVTAIVTIKADTDATIVYILSFVTLRLEYKICRRNMTA